MTYTLIKLAFKVSDMANKASRDYLMSLCHSAYFYPFGELVLVYAVVKEETNTDILSQYPVQEFNFDIPELENANITGQKNLNVKNGIEKYFMDSEL